MARSVAMAGVMLVVIVGDVLLAGVGSARSAGAATVATLVSVPVAGARPRMVNTTAPVDGSVGMGSAARSVKPVVAGHTAPLVAAQVIVTPVSALGTSSVTVAPSALSGPPLLTVTMYSTRPPAVTVAGPVLVIARSASRVTVKNAGGLLPLPGCPLVPLT